ncbi:DUF1700 domain-containing protein [Lactonifactor longoviformis]|nr:DUF1700 domain-containing protein [Lactonifactor longoviformis]POP30195.1 DUF1700 domain-containing protein [Lactonifactor longoviformis]
MYPRAVNADSRLDRTMSYRRKGWKVTQMSKGEFLDTLRSKLTGEIPPGKVRENIDYYSQYINDKVRTGIAEQDVIQMLGDPLLIARTIIDTQGCSEATDSGTAYSYETDPQESRGRSFGRSKTMKTWQILVIVLVILAVLFSILRVLIPIILPIVLIGFVISYFSKRR